MSTTTSPRFWNALPLLVMLFMLLLIATLLSCKSDEPQPAYISPLLESYVSEFVRTAKGFDRNVNIEGLTIFVDKAPDGQLGDCDGDTKTVIIDVEYYNRNKDHKWAMEVLVWHELGHCLLGRDHRDDCALTGITEPPHDPCWPKSIMHSTEIFELIEMEQFRQSFVWELFTHKD